MAYGVSFNPFVRYYVLDEGKGMFVGLYSSNRYSQWELENIPLEIIECISNSVNGRCDGYQADDTFKRVSKISVIGIEFGGTYFFNDTFFVEYTTGLGKKWGEKVSYNNRTGQGYDNYGAFPIALKANFNFGYNF